jgi:putative membrane protein
MKTSIFFIGASLLLFACNSNSNSSDSVEKADSANSVKQDMATDVSHTKENTADFLVKAANGGLTEVAAGKIGENKAVNKSVKDFAKLMVKDHSALNDQVKSLASNLNVTLPDSPATANQQTLTDLSNEKAKDFDKDFIDMMVKDHKSTISLFKDASDDDINADVKSFVVATIPTLESHLSKADSLQ